MSSFQAPYGRAIDQPVDGIMVEGDDVLLFVHANVNGPLSFFSTSVEEGYLPSNVSLNELPAVIMSIAITKGRFATLTRELKRGLAGCGHRH